jgi:Replication protein C N-terminal domain
MTKIESNFAAIESLAFDTLESVDGGYNITAHEALMAFDNVATYLGLDANDIALVHALIAKSNFQDWSRGNTPMVWLSDAQLQDITQLSAQALEQHTSNLVRNGMIVLDGDANMESFSHRNANDATLDMRGFDLSPLAARTPEFEWIAEALYYERQIAKRECDDAADLVGSILATLSSFACSAQNHALASIKDRFQKLLAALPFQGGKAMSASEKAKTFLGQHSQIGSQENGRYDDHSDYIANGSPDNDKQPDHGVGYSAAVDEIIADNVHVVVQAGSFYGRYGNASLGQPAIGSSRQICLFEKSWFAENDDQRQINVPLSNVKSVMAMFAEMPIEILRNMQIPEHHQKRVNRKAAVLRMH